MLVPLALLALILACCSSALASSSSPHGPYRVHRLCAKFRRGTASCLAAQLVPSSLTGAEQSAERQSDARQRARGERPLVRYKTPWPGYLTPAKLHSAYSLPNETTPGSTQTIAVVDAFDDPTAEADLAVYDQQFGLRPCTSANGCLRKLNEEGNPGPLPREEGEWASEISIDLQMSHAICQDCHILLVEAKSEQFKDLGAAVNAAASAGATEISNSYGGTEGHSYGTSFGPFYEHPGVAITASSGDCGYLNSKCSRDTSGANFPADFPAVVAVGGTSLRQSGGSWSASAWSEGGSGCSVVFEAPLWQGGIENFSATGCGSGRSIADVAAIGDPNTGVDIYDSTPGGEAPTGWGVWGGTSVASPIVAAEFALAGGAHAVPRPAATVYGHFGEASSLYDVLSGGNGSCAATTECEAVAGYDGPTGIGSPLGLGVFSPPGAPTDLSLPTIPGTPAVGETLKESHGSWSGEPSSYSYQWELCGAGGYSCEPIAGATGPEHEVLPGETGSTLRVQEIAANASGASSPAVSEATAAVPAETLAVKGLTPSSGITGSTLTIEGSGLSGATAVQVGKLAASFEVLSAAKLEAVVPNGAAAGKVSVITPGGTVRSATKFTPTLSVTHIPAAGAAGKTIAIKGLGFNSSSGVSFDGTPASAVTYVSAKKLKATVPAGASSGPVTVTNSASPLGTVSSASSFAVG
jgi:IPT/TIG domain